MTNSLQPISVAAQDQVSSPYYGLVWLAMASLAYTDESALDIAHVEADLANAVNALPDLPAPPGHAAPPAGSWGRWQLDWGPVVDHENANLLYSVSYREVATDLPVVCVVSIRGTDTQEHHEVLGLLRQIHEDLDVRHTVPWETVMNTRAPGTAPSVPSITIAQGSYDGLSMLRGLSAQGMDVLTYVRALAVTHPTCPVVVTGHSLGGCMAMVMAAYLSDALAAVGLAPRIVPHPFAGPTPGNTGFAAKFDAQFPGAHIWWNTLDVVPNAFQSLPDADSRTPSLTHIRGFWQDHGGPAINLVEKAALDAFIDLVHHYAQPTVNRQTLRGSVAVPAAGCPDTWTTQLLIQHLPPMYHRLISAQLSGVVAPYPLPPYPPGCDAVT